MQRVLISVPYTDNRLFDQTVDCLLALDKPADIQVDYLFQSGDDILIDDRRDRIIRKRNDALDMALQCGYDYLCFVDSDVVFHPDTFTRLWNTMRKYNPGVVYGLYVVRKEPYWWCCSICMEIQDDQPVHYVLSNDKEAARQVWNEEALWVSGIGFGMTLISRATLEQVSFRRRDNDNQYEDYWFGYDCQQAGIRQMMNLTARIGHILTDCKHVVWPSDNEQLYEIRELQ